jgi:hypothetical protein
MRLEVVCVFKESVMGSQMRSATGTGGPNAGRLNARSVIIAHLLACCTVILALGLAGIDV